MLPSPNGATIATSGHRILVEIRRSLLDCAKAVQARSKVDNDDDCDCDRDFDCDDLWISLVIVVVVAKAMLQG